QVEVSADLISQVTDSVMTTVIEWQNRPLDKVYPILIMDALIVKVRDGNHVQNKAFLFGLRNQSAGQQRRYLGFGWRRLKEPSSGYRS
ncbi:transposase, mutator-like family protein, partial [Leptospira weilii serovar Topaz str. LT2116]